MTIFDPFLVLFVYSSSNQSICLCQISNPISCLVTFWIVSLICAQFLLISEDSFGCGCMYACILHRDGFIPESLGVKFFGTKNFFPLVVRHTALIAGSHLIMIRSLYNISALKRSDAKYASLP